MVLLAVGVALQGAMPVSLRGCAMHATAHQAAALESAALDDDGPTHARHIVVAHEHGAHDHAAQGDGGRHHATTAPADAPAETPAPLCECLNDCCGVPTAVLGFAVAPLVAPAHRVALAAFDNPAPARTAPADRLLPFANGPPLHALG